MSDISTLEKLATDLEHHLGDPAAPGSVVGWAAALDHDDRERFHHEGASHLNAWRFPDYQVPATHGGLAVDIQDSLELFRLVARRDAALATSMATTSLSFMPIWIAGTDEQKSYWVERVRNGSAMSWGLSEREHGSDIVANDTTARAVDDGYVLNGEKWPIGNSALGDAVTVVARTGSRPGPAAFSILVVDRTRTPASALYAQTRLRLHGLRSIDNGGLTFRDAFVASDGLIGAEGQGMEIAIKAALAVRALAPAMALGCVDTGLRLTLDFIRRRNLFGSPVIDVPFTREQVVGAFADLLICDAVATGAVRGLQVRPDQSSIASSISKFWVPTVLERTMALLASILGARHFIQSDPHFGVFHKMSRDLWISHFAEGNIMVNLKNIASHLPTLTAAASESDPKSLTAAAERNETAFGLDEPLPPFQPWTLQIRSRRGDDVVTGLPATVNLLRDWIAVETGEQAEHLRIATEFATRFVDRLAAIGKEFDSLVDRTTGWAKTAEAYRLAEQYAVVHAAGSVLAMSVHNRGGRLPDALPDPAVLVVCLARLWAQIAPTDAAPPLGATDAAAAVLLGLHDEGRLFAHRQTPLAVAPGHESAR